MAVDPAAGAHLCTRGGKQPTAHDLEVVAEFARFLQKAGPAPTVEELTRNRFDGDECNNPEHAATPRPQAR